MGKFSKKMKQKYKETNKKSIAVYLILRLLVVISMIFQILMGNLQNAMMCILSLLLFTIPTIVTEKLKIGLPSLLEALILGHNVTYSKRIFMCRNWVFISRYTKSK